MPKQPEKTSGTSEKRKAAFDAIVALEARHDQEYAAAAADYETADARYQAADQAARLALQARNEALRVLRMVSIAADSQKRNHEKLLRETADPRIRQVYDLVDDAFHSLPTKNGIETVEQRGALNTRRAGVLQALDKLWCENLTEQELIVRLAELCGKAKIEVPSFLKG